MILALRNLYPAVELSETRKLSTPGEPKRGIGLRLGAELYEGVN